jgi:uncharacterized Zn finger protein
MLYSYTAMVRLNLPFACPVCSSDEFHQVILERPDGVRRVTGAYECAGCSTMFRDADKFTKHRLTQRKPPPAG